MCHQEDILCKGDITPCFIVWVSLCGCSHNFLLVRICSRHGHHDTRSLRVGKQDKKIHWRYFESLFFNDCCFLADSMGGPWSHCYALGFFQQKGHLIGISGIILPPVLRLKYSDSIHSFIQWSLIGLTELPF